MRRARRALGAVLASLLSACAHGRPSGSDGDAAAPVPPVAQVDEDRVTKADLSDFVFTRFREEYWQAVGDLVDERIVRAESRRLGVSVPAGALDAAVAAEAKAREADLKARFGEKADLAESVRAYYGLDAEAWKRDVLRPRLAVRLALERVVRLSTATRERVLVRVLVVRDPAKARALREKLDRGADFSLLALEASIDPSRSAGGAIPPVVAGDLPPDVEGPVFQAPPGSLVGPLSVAGPGGTAEVHLYKVIAHEAPWQGDPAALGPRLEEDLRSSPVSAAEYARWSARARREHGVRYFAPDGSLLREPERGR